MIIHFLDFTQWHIGMNMLMMIVNLFVLSHSDVLLDLPIYIPLDGFQQSLAFLLYIRDNLLSLKFFIYS